MPLYKFKSNDIYHNRIKVHPKQELLLYNSRTIFNRKIAIDGILTDKVTHASEGHVNLYELNVDRPADKLIYPFIIKSGKRNAQKTISLKETARFAHGSTLTGSYPLSASVSKLYFAQGQSRKQLDALRNSLDFYKNLSLHYAYSSSLGDKSDQELGLLSIPSIFYGSSIKKGSVDLKFYISGTLTARAKDTKQNGELIEVTGTSVGSVAGVVLYDEGFLVLTGSWNLSNLHTETYGAGGATAPTWIYFGQSISGSITAVSSSFILNFEGTDYIPTITMLAHALKGELNHSNNPTYVKFDANRTLSLTGGLGYHEPNNTAIKNTVSSSYQNHTASFEKHTYISKIGIYDKDKNLIGIAKLATPVKKTQNRDFTFKLKLDI